ncbi:MAG: hypothetical protein JSV16_16115 [Candidatus Hydrogenedentota bacterium]|nr:MAG: hypothetical protein JSV16_16115 [Candidatus Hydrogenedentota bacterium]
MSIRRIVIVLVLILGLSVAGCSRMDREQLKMARAALKQGNTKAAINNVQQVLRRSPRNIYAKYLMGKITAQLLEDAQESLEAKNYKEALKKVETVLEIDPKNEDAKAVHTAAKKHLLLAEARTALENDNPMAANIKLNEALQLDPQFQEAKTLHAEASRKAEEKIANLVITAQALIQQEKFEELRELAQDILTIDTQNREAEAFLREAQAQILLREKEKNLAMARKFYDEGIYESALSKAEEVLKVDPDSFEAKQLVEKSMAELAKPELRLTGISKIKGMVIAHIEIPSTRERFAIKEGETFGDFKVSAIDLDLKAVVVTYMKTGSQQSITTTPE